MNHKCSEYERRESAIFSSDRQFPRKGGFVKINFGRAEPHFGLSFVPHLVLRLRGGASNHDDENDFVGRLGVDSISTANIPLEIAHTAAPVNLPLQPTGWMMDVNGINNKLIIVKRQIGSDSNKDKHNCLAPSPGEDKTPHLVLRLRGGASNHDGDSDFVETLGLVASRQPTFL